MEPTQELRKKFQNLQISQNLKHHTNPTNAGDKNILLPPPKQIPASIPSALHLTTHLQLLNLKPTHSTPNNQIQRLNQLQDKRSMPTSAASKSNSTKINQRQVRWDPSLPNPTHTTVRSTKKPKVTKAAKNNTKHKLYKPIQSSHNFKPKPTGIIDINYKCIPPTPENFIDTTIGF